MDSVFDYEHKIGMKKRIHVPVHVFLFVDSSNAKGHTKLHENIMFGIVWSLANLEDLYWYQVGDSWSK